jgi:hypothetical protein
MDEFKRRAIGAAFRATAHAACAFPEGAPGVWGMECETLWRMWWRRAAICLVVCGLAPLAGCGDEGATTTVTAPVVDACDNGDGALDDAGFVFVSTPVVGQRVSSGFAVKGCSRSFEANVPWELLDAQGATIARGFTQGGGVDGAGPFRFTVTYRVARRQIGVLVVREDDPSDGEGFPPKDNRIPLVLQP